MMQLSTPAPAPLYSFDTRDVTTNTTGGTSYIQFSNGNHIKSYSVRRYAAFGSFNNWTSTVTTENTSWPAMFTLAPGDVILWRMKNVTVKSTVGSTTTVNVTCWLRSDTQAKVVGINDTSVFSLKGGQTLTFDVVEDTATMEAATNVQSLRIYPNSTGQGANLTLEFDLEVYVNGVRYI